MGFRSASRLPRGTKTLLLSGPEALGASACGLTFAAWNTAARGSFDPVALLFLLAVSYVITLAGKLILRLVLPHWSSADFPTIFIFGFFGVSTALYVLALASPLGMIPDAILVLCGVVTWGIAQRRPESGGDPAPQNVCWLPGLTATLVSLLAATFWSADAICPVVTRHGTVVFKPWSDGFFHASMVRMFRDSHGFHTLANVLLPGRSAQLYHYAPYSLPALLATFTGTPCYEAFSSFLIPTGVFLTGLAAYALVRTWWGPNAGVAATAAVLLLPDASFYGVSNPFLGYHWLQQIAPAGTYGVSLAAIAWLLVFEGCRTGRWLTTAFGLAAAGLVIIYKAHIFVAIALPIWLAPALLLPGIKTRWRALWLVSAAAAFVAVTSLARFVPAVPVLRLDGSGMPQYVEVLAFNLPTGAAHEYFTVPLASSSRDVFIKGAEHVLLGTFGLLGPACVVLMVLLLRRKETDGSPYTQRDRVGIALFPLVVIANYLVMALGLAPDRNLVTQADELMHRPLVWAYFVTAAWVGGAFYELVLKVRFAQSRRVRNLSLAVLGGLLLVPFLLGDGIQVGPGWGKDHTNTNVANGLYRCALFLRERSPRRAVVQDSARAPDKVLEALSERPEYVMEYPNATKRELLADRLESARRLDRIVGIAELKRYAASLGVSWYVLRPGGRVYWDPRFLARPVFEADGYRVYSLASENR